MNNKDKLVRDIISATENNEISWEIKTTDHFLGYGKSASWQILKNPDGTMKLGYSENGFIDVTKVMTGRWGKIKKLFEFIECGVFNNMIK